MADSLVFDRIDHLVRHAKHGIAGKTHHDGTFVCICRETFHGQGFFNGRREVLVSDVVYPGPADQAGGIDVVLVGILRPLDTVGGHDNGAGELGKFLCLILPGGAVMAVEMAVFLQFRIAVTGQHFAVGVHIDALACRLRKDGRQVLQVMAGYQDCLAPSGAEGHLGRHRMAVSAGVAGIKQFHGPEVDFAAFQHQADPFIHAEILAQDRSQAFLDKGIDLVVFLAENPGMVGIGRNPFQTEEENVFQGDDVRIFITVDIERHRFPLFDQSRLVGCRQEIGCLCREIGFAAGGFDLFFQPLSELHRFIDQGHETVCIKIDIGQG